MDCTSSGGESCSGGGVKQRRSRKKKAMSTLEVKANANNFRELVQHYTGCHTSSSYPFNLQGRGPINLNFEHQTYSTTQHQYDDDPHIAHLLQHHHQYQEESESSAQRFFLSTTPPPPDYNIFNCDDPTPAFANSTTTSTNMNTMIICGPTTTTTTTTTTPPAVDFPEGEEEFCCFQDHFFPPSPHQDQLLPLSPPAQEAGQDYHHIHNPNFPLFPPPGGGSYLLD